MNRWRVFMVAFWVFIFVMLARQAYNYNNQVAAYAQSHPEKHLFYNPGGAAPPPKAPAPDVRQVAYRVIPASPAPGSFTVQFTVKNQGNVAATGIQVKVRPYRGMINGDEDNGHAHGSDGSGVGPISDTDPLSQYGQWVSIPNLAPGQSGSDSAVFADQPGAAPNENPKLEITFVPLKSN